MKRLFFASAASVVVSAFCPAVSLASAPPNDTFAGAQVIPALPFTVTQDTTQATVDTSDPPAAALCPASGPSSNSVWFAYTSPVDQLVDVEAGQSSYIVTGAILTGSPASFSKVACLHQTQALFEASRGTTYYIRLAQVPAGHGGTLKLSVLAARTSGGAGWSVQYPPNPLLSTEAMLSGVSCTSASFCAAVGENFVTPGVPLPGGSDLPLIEMWDGTRWSISPFALPAGASEGILNAVSCTSPSFCEAVGRSRVARVQVPLVELWDGRTWSPQRVPATAQDSQLAGVSCTSRTFCMAVGGTLTEDASFQPNFLAERWNGAAWRSSPVPATPGPRAFGLTGVSCVSPVSCLAVGNYGVVGEFAPSHALREIWNGRVWRAKPVGPVRQYTALSAVACPGPEGCYTIGTAMPANGLARALSTFYDRAGAHVVPIADPWLNGDALTSISCTRASVCWAVGETSTGLGGVLYDRGRGQDAFLPEPTDVSGLSLGVSLRSVSCPTSRFCEAVGQLAGAEALAEQYRFSLPRGCCAARRPASFGLSVSGTLQRGAAISVRLQRAQELVLVVQGPRFGTQRIYLGRYPRGHSRIHWDLRLDGLPLWRGRYRVRLYGLTGDVVSAPTPPGTRTLIVLAGGRVRIGS